MARSPLVLLCALLLLAAPAWAGETEEASTVDSPAVEGSKEAAPTEADADHIQLQLDLSWNPARSEETLFTNTESASSAPATLRILCTTTDARVQVDGEGYGEAPRVISGIEPGIHTVTVELPSGRSYSRQVFLRGGSVEELTVHATGTRDEEAAFVLRTISTILATLVAIPLGATDSARLAGETEIPGLITNFDVVEPIPRD